MKICAVCANRLLGCNNFTKFYETAESLPVDEKLQKFVNSETMSNQLCIMCFGFLTRSKFGEYKDAIRNSVKKWPLEKEASVKDFQMLITVPAIMPLIENIVYYTIKKEVTEVILPDNINLKEILKTVCCNDLLENCLIQAESELKVSPKFLCEEFEKSFITGLIASERLSNEVSYKLEGIYKTKARAAKHKKWGKKAKVTESEVQESLTPTINASTVSQTLNVLSPTDLANLGEYLSSLTPKHELTVETTHSPVYIAGRYQKYSRTLPQTPWLVDGKRHYSETSVEEIIAAPFVEATGAQRGVLTSAGREDVDVRTLGNGRPFIIELLKPRKLLATESAKILAAKVNENQDLKITDVCIIEKSGCKTLLEGEVDKKKEYRAYCYSERKITSEDLKKLSMSEVVLKQKTPIRVLHRRNNDTRPRSIHKAEGKRWEGRSENWFYIDLLTQAGTYIKEFVHGDFGRTKPNVTEIFGCECDIVGLDVTNVHLDWPPTVPENEQIVEKSS
ncbi:unnamed protein product [Oikopleura dioica]|uniref:tRNA pseudouridine(55) synthase n=1 Tax=Oikopleura dioica TaxID=34765 RepID=E4Y5X2_OIKDI|nr:unnamed protein product [Oikopleura dioica]